MATFIKTTLMILLFVLPFVYSCSDNTEGNQMEEEEMDDKDNAIKAGKLSIRITDAPIDDTRISGAFMTFTGVKVGDETIMLDNKVTLDVMTLQDGNSYQLLNDSIEIGTYTTLELIVDQAYDAEGNQPGCYILDENQMKHQLETQSSGTFMLNLASIDHKIQENTSTEWIVDIDLRKVIRHEDSNDENDHYTFATDIQSSLRVVDDHHFNVKGNIQDILGVAGDEAIVYLYKKGSFNLENEVSVSSSTDVQFANAITSSMVKPDGSFELHFLDDDEYEVQVISYDIMSDGSIEAKGVVQVNSIDNTDLLDIQLTSDLELNLTALAVVPF